MRRLALFDARGREVAAIVSGLLSLLLAGAVCAGASSKVKPKAGGLNDFYPMNTADLPDRCPNELFLSDPNEEFYKKAAAPGDPDIAAIDAVLLEDKITRLTLPYFMRQTDFYARRGLVLRKLQDRVEGKKGAERIPALEGYSRILLNMGEFERLASYFGPRRDLHEKRWYIAFNLAQAEFRLGMTEASLRHAKRAHELHPVLDTRWQYLVSQLATHGPGFFKKFSMPGFTLAHIRRLFPNEDLSALPFEDATDRLGIGMDRWAGRGSVSLVDLDGDHWDDLIMERESFPPRIYRNLQGKRFEALADDKMGSRTCDAISYFAADYDNDGKTDLFHSCCNFMGGGPPALLKNAGGLSFTDATKGALPGFPGGAFDFAWGDFDLDGFVDLAVTDVKGPSRLYRNNGDGTFADATRAAGISTPGPTKDVDNGALAVTWGDYDDDGYPDLFLQGWGWRRLYRNKGDGTFEDATGPSGIKNDPEGRGFMGSFFDTRNTGRLDLLIGQYPLIKEDGPARPGPECNCAQLLAPAGYSQNEWNHSTTLFGNNGDGTFAVQQRFIPLGTMGFNHGDWDNDGHQDIILGAGGNGFQQAEPYLFYHNNGTGTFVNMTPFTARGLWGKGHGISFGDFDHDGHLDVALNNGGSMPGDTWPSLLLHNKGGKNHFLSIALKAGAGTNGSAIGARVWVHAGDMVSRQDIVSGTGPFGGSSLSLHFGLGARAKADKIVVKWPNRAKTETRLRDVAADQAIEIDESSGTYRRLWAPQKR